MVFFLIVAAGLLAGALPARWDGNWTAHVVRLQPRFVDRFFPFDALWYERIARVGYEWNPAAPALKQDVAFFPAWPLVLRALGMARWMAVAAAAGFATASIWAFHVLAEEVLPASARAGGTWLFALWPGAGFLLLSYPTGLMNLLGILSLLALLRERFWLAAVLAGGMTGCGPLGLGTAAAVWVSAARARWRRAGGRITPTDAGTTIVLGILAISGLLGFVLFQAWRFGDPLAFVKAQAAWATPVPPLPRIPRAITQLLILPDFVSAMRFLARAGHAANPVQLQAALESALQCAALGLALLMLRAGRRVLPLPVLLQGAFTLLLFVWFHSATRPGNSTLRLTYCAFTTILGLAWLLRNRPLLRRCVIAGFGTLAAGGAFLSAAGYHAV